MKIAHLLLVATCLVAQPTYAASSAASSLSQFQYSTSKLGSQGGVASITWGQPSTYSIYSWANATSLDTIQNGPTISGNGPLQAGSSSVIGSLGGAQSALVGNGLGADFRLTSSGFVAGGETLWTGAYFGSGTILNSVPFTISPWTTVTFSAFAQTVTSLSQGIDEANQSFEYASANVWLRVEGPSATAQYGWQSEQDVLRNQAGYTLNGTTFNTLLAFASPAISSRFLSVTFENSSAYSVSGSLMSIAETYGFSSITPVPEPETYAMLLAGIGLIAFVERLHNKQTTAACQKHNQHCKVALAEQRPPWVPHQSARWPDTVTQSYGH